MTDPSRLTLPAPAKLNRLLHITGRRDDGYHLLQTLFQFLDHGDTLTFRESSDERLELDSPLAEMADDDNLVLRAARRLQQRSGTSCGARIRLHKTLPMGGGLGGGSSDAATTLHGLNRLWRLGLRTPELAEIGLELGADVPVFVHGHAAWAEGIGEQLTRVELDTPWFLVIHPGVNVSTPTVFKDPELTRDTPPITITRALQGGASGWRNDCEATVRRLYPAVDAALDWLGSRAPTMLTGTGACVFARLESQAEAASLARELPVAWQAFVARGVNRSPLQDALDR
ncbi:4-(cytidine 5'-diphospho)-2-C-methyl-D-erythritol kinase [Halomonas sp. 18H]|uniref:4-(cytidine 5'-diphospho)-2-C-methyl-D-erythritol kinase n=1 Tax=Halomonas almeriensis TaxID=308163 RepID=UPI002232597B|nr:MULTISPECIES: 4-(cytidine 5'-diphospho)-2-C-methyl-D-erythritol kinase [Halomonas]MCW4151580.1 4-(cytidine 5'-diphospho)-2-C-methyl-D-erythritol kinase [Halomonas sp. 18H]MDN3552717.1 4-(cytidine 5'-diphospho)-2-C-methyl-D-erythritol kinase [Halomonas almeriensis]